MAKIVGVLFLFAFYAISIPEAMLVWQDVRAGGDWQPAVELQITEAKCVRYYFVLSNCDVRYTSKQSAGKEQKLSYAIFGGWGGDRTFLVWSASDHSQVTTDIGVRDLGWRIFELVTMTLGVTFVFFGAMIRPIRRDTVPGNDEGRAAVGNTGGPVAASAARAQFPLRAGGAGPKVFGKRR